MIDLALARDDSLLALLRSHPKVAKVGVGGDAPLTFHQGAWQREVRVGDASVRMHGLIELMDNNPMVCADIISVPGPAATLALIALGPLAAAGAIAETPTVLLSIPTEDEDVSGFLAEAGWSNGVIVATEAQDLRGAAAATALVEVPTPESLDELDDLFEERFGRSFFVRRDEESEWSPELVRGRPNAIYRLRVTPDEPVSLLTVHALADLGGKCGAAQIVHAMNVMAGYEESLGLA